MVKICDALPGSGKSSSCINYMNEHPDEKYIYITPYLPEAKRIKDGCPGLHFYTPTKANKDTYHSKTLDTFEQIKNGRNITTTHSAFLYYTPEIIEEIQRQGYTLMADESVNILEELTLDSGDFEVMVEAGYVKEVDGRYVKGKDGYHGTQFKQAYRILKSRELLHVDGDSYKNDYYYWALPVQFFMAFKEAIIMTYMFESQDLCYYFRMSGVPYEYIGIRHDESGYHFDETASSVPRNIEYERQLRDKIHICDVDSLNRIGNNRHALSMNWFATNKPGVKKLQLNLRSYFRYHQKEHPRGERMFGTFKDPSDKLEGDGWKGSGLVFNSRATNDYADKKVLAYCCNLFLDGGRKKFFNNHGIEINEDDYALSTMVQWIFRSAIRRGEDVWIYVPSRRMRELLENWLNGLAEGGEVQGEGMQEVQAVSVE